MTEYMLSPRGNFAARENLRDMLDAGELDAYRIRGNGTTRLLKLLPVASTDRETAEWIYDQVEDGRSVQSVAREIHSSTATVRRFLEALEITEQVEAGEWDAHWADTNGFAYTPPVDEMDNDQLAKAFADAAMVDDVMGNRWHASALEGETGVCAADLENADMVDSEATTA